MADITTTQHGESMNNMIKGYLDANTSLTMFITAFQSALDTQNEKTEFRIYQQNNFNIIYKTTSIFEYQVASILTTYAFKKTQEQLMQSFMYKCEEIASEEEIINNYIVFSTSTSTSPQSTLSSIEPSDDQNYQYMLTRLLQKVQRFAIQNPTIATTLYNSFNEIFISEHPSNKRITSTIELTKPLNEIQDSNTITTSSQFQDPDFLDHHFIETNIFFDELNLEREDTQCLYCSEALPSPLLLKVSKYLNDIATKKIEQYEFCQVHKGEGIIIPYRVEKGYPLQIDFTILPNRVRNLKCELLKVIKGQWYSEYHVDAIKKIQEIGVSKVNSLLLQINYFESFQPGYYGTKGLAIILKTLTEMFVQPKILTTNLCTPQSSSQYLAQVLTPETAIRLIVEDFNNISLDIAKKIMINNIEFGLYIHDDDNDNIKNNQYFNK
ncbi:1594_t:CDS:2 [Dentiscutata erythropus]|uniref:Restriction of telomere capping protein 4 n=1 Tax=Dentiscutata erythropus TaxID=1348616 RepID=A0A9N9J047_9GLOM|nr:1594_t:CDS:2 [Dentiscutata erythropus]